jgi:mannitol/fructose-specific phosphotransferase system IIA component (Ntr-type)
MVLQDVLGREKIMSTGMQHGIAIPHGKTDGIKTMSIAIGIKKGGMDFASLDGVPSRIFIMVVSPKKTSGPHLQFLAAISSILKNQEVSDSIISAASPEEIEKILKNNYT